MICQCLHVCVCVCARVCVSSAGVCVYLAVTDSVIFNEMRIDLNADESSRLPPPLGFCCVSLSVCVCMHVCVCVCVPQTHMLPSVYLFVR